MNRDWVRPASSPPGRIIAILAFLAFAGGAFAKIAVPPQPGMPPAPAVPGSQSSPTQNSTKLTKLAPDSVLVQMNGGTGEARIVYARKAGEAAPTLDWTDAVGTTNSIPKSRISVWGEGQPRTVGTYETVTLAIKVETPDWVESAATYQGRIIFLWPDAPAQTEDFTLSNTAATDFTLSRAKIDAVVMTGQPAQADFIINNTGRQKITKLTLSCTNLEVASTHRRADCDAPQPITIDLSPGREQTIAVPLPSPHCAGMYSGTLNVVANDQSRKSIPLSIATRGPTLGKAPVAEFARSAPAAWRARGGFFITT